MSVSDRPRHLRLSRFESDELAAWDGHRALHRLGNLRRREHLWIPPLLWTVLPIGLTLYLFAERYPWRVNLVLVVPLALLTASAQVVASSTDAPTVVAFGIYLVACSYFSTVLFVSLVAIDWVDPPRLDGSSANDSHPAWHGSASRSRSSRRTPWSARSAPPTIKASGRRR